MSALPGNAPIRVLVAEDSPTQAQRLRHLLQRQGYEVAVAPNGREALDLARTFRPTLIISDVVMPEMDGYELSRRIKADAALAQIPVMLVTTLADPHDVIRGIEAGADNFVVKPYQEGYLSDRVEFLLANRFTKAPEQSPDGVTIHFNGQQHVITATREQILNLLLSTYQAAIERNRELVRTQAELQGAMRELESFSHSVSHDLRAPLHKIHGFGELLLEDYAERLDDTGRHYLERMIAGAAKMNELIEAMLALSQVSRADLVASEVDLSAIAERILADLRERDPARRCESRVQPGMKAFGDARLFDIALTNLLGNAWKFSSGREVTRIEVGELPANGQMAVFFVRDNGAGFDPQYAERLFAAFQRLHTEKEFPGTGIGLATVRRVVERHEGNVWAESLPGQGATFYFSVPSRNPS